MPYKAPHHHGNAEQRHWFEIPLTQVSGLIAEEEPTYPQGLIGHDERRYAQYVYQVNATPLTLSGDVDIDRSALEALIEETNLRLDSVNTHLTSGIIDPALAKYIEEAGNKIWIAEAAPGTVLASATWRIKEIEEIDSGSLITTSIKWADGNSNFDNIATPPLSAHTFS